MSNKGQDEVMDIAHDAVLRFVKYATYPNGLGGADWYLVSEGLTDQQAYAYEIICSDLGLGFDRKLPNDTREVDRMRHLRIAFPRSLFRAVSGEVDLRVSWDNIDSWEYVRCFQDWMVIDPRAQYFLGRRFSRNGYDADGMSVRELLRDGFMDRMHDLKDRLHQSLVLSDDLHLKPFCRRQLDVNDQASH